MVGIVFAALALAGVVLVIILVVQRAVKKGEDSGTGADIIAYLILALAMGVAGFALAQLAATAFPGARFVFDPAQDLATSLAGLVVAVPFVVYLWRRQADRRVTYPRSSGWTLYLSVVDLAFVTAFVVATVLFVNGLLTEETASAWTGTLVFGALVAFHEVASRRTPPMSDAHDLPRVVGSAIGLITGGIGVGGTLAALFGLAFDLSSSQFDPFVAMAIVGIPVWAYYWFRRWRVEPGVPRLTWLVVVSVGSSLVTLAATTTVVVLSLQYMLATTGPVREHFNTIPGLLGVFFAAFAIWAIHRRALGPDRTNSLRMYEYSMAAVGLTTSGASAIWLTIIALDAGLLVGGGTSDVITLTVPLVIALVVWRYFESRPDRGLPEEEIPAWPRRLYHLGLGIVASLVAAGALITVLFVLLRRALDSADNGDSIFEPSTVLIYAGLAAWYLLAGYVRDRAAVEDEEVATPFEVTVVCSHPGPLAVKFPTHARLRVIHRGDDIGIVDEELADRIVAEVGQASSLVWVDGDGFRVAPQLKRT